MEVALLHSFNDIRNHRQQHLHHHHCHPPADDESSSSYGNDCSHNSFSHARIPMTALLTGAMQALFLLTLLSSLLLSPVNAAYITFEDCLPENTQRSNQLQFTPLFVDATFEGRSHQLNLTIYGNVSGQQFTGTYPPPSSPQWNNPNVTFGKISEKGSTGAKLSTLTAGYTVLTYSAFDPSPVSFCDTLANNATCPLGPAFYANASDPNDLPAIFQSHSFGSSYAFTTISATVHIISGEDNAANIGCVSAQITPDLGPRISGLLTWLPAAILMLKALATLSAAIWSPWGSSDVFRWSSNYGRDEDLLRLVTPGFGDCLQYIQFVVLTGSLRLQYPGFYQPAVSQASWSVLLFNESFVSGGSGTVSQVDGLYATNATYGLTKMSQYIGMTRGEDIWACMAIWLCVIAAAVIVLCQLVAAARWIYLAVTHTSEEDLRQKNIPFTLGNIVRLLFNYFILPIVALSLFQLVISEHSTTAVIACAAVLLVLMIAWAGWILRIIFSTKPRTLLFDDMPTVLLYGPLYNTYSDSAAPFALIPVFITFMRGVAIGAVQPSGIAQIIILAVCEVILILTLNAFRPFQGQTSMNLYHTFFAVVRVITILMMIAFAPSLGVTEPTKGWIGYVILLLHACVLIFGFFLNAAQALVEVIARSLGAGNDDQHGAIRGSIMNSRMLKKRQTRPDQGDRASMMSSAAILRDAGDNTAYGGRSRSISASSQQLLGRMSGYENFSSANEPFGSPDAESSTFVTMSSSVNGRPIIGTKANGEKYYRPPRQRKATLEELASPGGTSRGPSDFPYRDSPAGHAREASYDSATFGSPAPAYFRARHESGDETANRTDYAVREVDQYYRGEPLNEEPSRKLKTGPADPEGPASTAQSWFQRVVFGVKGKKDQSKGFEVVRSSRMPPGSQQRHPATEGMELQQSPVMHEEPYRDSPVTPRSEVAAAAGAERPVSPISAETVRPVTRTFDFGFEGSSDTTAAVGVRPDSDVMGTLGHPVLEPISTEHRASMGNMANLRRLSQISDESRYTGRESSQYDDNEPSPIRNSGQPVPSLGTMPSQFNSNGALNVPSHLTSGTESENFPDRRMSAATSIDNRSNYDIGASAGGQDWLRAVDNIDWDLSRPSTRGGQTPINGMSTPPGLPLRNSRRVSTQDLDSEEKGWTGLGSNDSRPANVTHQVIHHRAADSITRNSFGANAALQASSAEYFGRTPSPNDQDYLRDD